MSPQRFRRPAILLLALHLHACTSWQAIPEVPRPRIVNEEPAARITTLDGSRIVVLQPRLEGDSILGMNEVSRKCEIPGSVEASVCQETSLSFSLIDLQLLEVRRPDPAKTFGAIVGGGGVLLLALTILIGCSSGGEFASPC